MVFFRFSTPALLIILLVLVAGSALLGLLVGRSRREQHHGLKESSGVLQGALLGFMGLVLAFGLSLALGRYEGRRAAVVDDANAIGTTYLRAQTLSEPMRSRSLSLLVKYADTQRELTDEVPGSDAADKPSPRAPLCTISFGRLLVRPSEGSDCECTTPLRGKSERDDRPADSARRGIEQPCAD